MCRNAEGRFNGQVFVEFEEAADASRAHLWWASPPNKDRKPMGSRYVEVCPASSCFRHWLTGKKLVAM